MPFYPFGATIGNIAPPLPVVDGGTGLIAAGTAQQVLGIAAGAPAWVTPTPYAPEPLTSGEALVLRSIAGGTAALTSGDVLFSYWTAIKTESCSHVRTITGGTAAGTPTYGAVGIYSVDSSGNLTKIIDSGDLHATIWAATFTEYNVALTSAFSKVAGTRYAVGALSVATTAPSLYGAAAQLNFTQAPVMSSAVTGQATLPASVAVGSLVGGPPFGFVMQAVVAP